MISFAKKYLSWMLLIRWSFFKKCATLFTTSQLPPLSFSHFYLSWSRARCAIGMSVLFRLCFGKVLAWLVGRRRRSLEASIENGDTLSCWHIHGRKCCWRFLPECVAPVKGSSSGLWLWPPIFFSRANAPYYMSY